MKRKSLTKKQQLLLENYEEMSEYLQELLSYKDSTIVEMEYLTDFIRYKELDTEYRYFRENAVKDPNEDLPFPHYIL